MKTDNLEGKEPDPKKGFPINVFTFVVFWLPAVASAFFGDYILAGVLFAIGLGCWFGFQIGALKAVGTAALVIGGFYFAPQYAYLAEPKFNEWLGISGLNNRLVSIIAVFVVFAIVAKIVMWLIASLFLKKGSFLERSNRFFGLTIGGIEMALAALLFLGGIQMIEPMMPQQDGEEQVTDVFAMIATVGVPLVAEETRSSVIGPSIVEHNPFTKYPEYNPFPKVQQTVQFLSDGERLKSLLKGDALLDKLQASAAFTDAMKKLGADPTIQETINSGDPFGPELIMALMNSDTLLEIIDQPGFLEEAAKIFSGTEVEFASSPSLIE